ncbi:MAG: ATP-binding protein [Victivallales bacterium]|jgi:SpoVK/Ycf46/Vps4 family AAA+-type ATPase
MGRFFYRTRSSMEPSDFIRAETLKFTLNYIKNSNDLSSEAVLDNLLCFLGKSEVERIIGKYLKIIKAKGRTAEGFTDGLSFRRLYKELIEYLTDNFSFPEEAVLIDDIIRAGEKALGNCRKNKKVVKGDLFAMRLCELQKAVGISDEAMEVFKVIYFAHCNHDFENMCQGASLMLNNRHDSRAAIVNLKLLTGYSEQVVKQAVAKDAPLRKYGILEDDFDIVHQISEFLTGLSPEPLSNKFFRKFEGQPVGLEAHSNVGNHAEIIEKLIMNRADGEGVNILLYGKPGTGKTEFCRSLGRHLGKDIYEINTYENDDRPASGNRFRFTALKACQNTVALNRSVIVIDEADEMLNGGSTASSLFFAPARNTEKDIVNDYLDKSPGVYFWITNHSRSIEESTRRRFDYSIEFRRFSTAQRGRLWQSCIGKHRLEGQFTPECIAGFARKYEVNAGGIDIALKNYRRMIKSGRAGENQKEKAEVIDTILKPHISLMTGNKRKRDLSEPAPFYSLEGLNIKGETPISESLEIMKHFSERMEEAGVGGKKERISNMNLLMYGPPGTGKTEFAKFAAMEIGRPLLCKRGSDLLSMWVGGTEHNIREAFSEAEEEGAILFIDEADGLIAERGNAQRSWEVTQVNELLSNMEEFRGILICATNFKKNLDTASIRRFNIKIEFDYLDSEGKRKFFGRVLGDLTGMELDGDEVVQLERIENLAPGISKSSGRSTASCLGRSSRMRR